jgi:nucleoside-diphosphate-sugar epimerase
VSDPLIILGCGYIGGHLARAALAAGRQVRVCARSTGRLQPLGALGAEVKFVDASTPKQLTLALSGLPSATVIYALPPVTALPPGHAMRAALQAAYGGGAGCFIHLASTGRYGSEPDDEVWIDEDTPPTHDDPPMKDWESDEEAVERCEHERLRTVTLRLAPVYGPGRGVRTKLRKGEYRILDEGQHVTSRIYIDDVVQVVLAAEARAARGARYLVADDEPTTQGEYARWLSEHLGLPMPPYKPILAAGAQRVAHRNRKIRNARLKQDLGLTLRFPSFREGEVAIDAAEAEG